MFKKIFLIFIFLFLTVMFLFSISYREEHFIIVNLSSTELILHREFYNFPIDKHRIQSINNIDINITFYYFKNDEVIIKPSKDYFGILSYRPVGRNRDEVNFYFYKLDELTLYEKMKAIFFVFSIRTLEGGFVIKDIDDLCNVNIKKIDNSYIIEISDEDIKYAAQT